MSFNQSLLNIISHVVDKFTDEIAEKYNIDKKELNSLWTGTDMEFDVPIPTPIPIKKKKNVVEKKILLPEEVFGITNAELKALCKINGHKCGGKKSVLINRLLGKDEDAEVDIPKNIKKVKSVKSNTAPIIKKLVANIPKVLIRRNAFGNYEHSETKFVFDNETQEVIGKQNDDDTISALLEEDIDICNAFKFKYKTPDNLDQTQLEDVKVNELDEGNPEDENNEDIEIIEELEEDEDIEYEEEEVEIEDDEL